MKSTGFYVEGRSYGAKYGQAFARARWLSFEYGRIVNIMYQPPQGELYRFESVLSAQLPVDMQRRALSAA